MHRSSYICFNPRAREGRDDAQHSITAPSRTFQSTRPRGARHRDEEGVQERGRVSIHAPARGATVQPQRQPIPLQVSIHAPARGATVGGAVLGRAPLLVSIHAPARGATFDLAFLEALPHVSIHAPARGATSRGRSTSAARPCFNPRAREGRDGRCRWARGSPTRVSIHAPARGATVKVYIRMQIKLICYASLKLPRHPARKTSPKNAYKPREPTGSTSSLQVRAGQSKPKCIKVLRGHTHHHGPTAPRAPSSSFPDYKSASYPYRRQ